MAEVLDRDNFLDNIGDELNKFAYYQSWHRLNQFSNSELTPEIMRLFDSPDETLVLAGSIGADIRSIYRPVLEKSEKGNSHIKIDPELKLIFRNDSDQRIYCEQQNHRPGKVAYTVLGAYIPTAKGIDFNSSGSIKATDIYRGVPRIIRPLRICDAEQTAQAQKDYVNVLHQLTRLVTQHVKPQ